MEIRPQPACLAVGLAKGINSRRRTMDSDLANIALICFLMGVGIVTFIGIALGYLVVMEFLETFYFKD
jgi:hypothetical protein